MNNVSSRRLLLKFYYLSVYFGINCAERTICDAKDQTCKASDLTLVLWR